MLAIKEEWKDIKGYEGLYQISNTGNVKSLERRIDGKKCHRKLEEKILKPIETDRGYLRVKLSRDNKVSKVRIHRLVAEAFIEKPELEVNHIDGNKKNNCIENLEWVTSKENKQHAKSIGLYRKKKEEHL